MDTALDKSEGSAEYNGAHTRRVRWQVWSKMTGRKIVHEERLPFRQLWENYYPTLLRDYDITDERDKDNWVPCLHVREDDTLPFVLMTYNEGGLNTTGVCLLCVLEYAKKLIGEP